MSLFKPLEYIYYRTYSFVQKNKIPFVVQVGVKATAVTVFILLLALLTLYMLLSVNGIIDDNGITILVLSIGISFCIFPLDRYFEQKRQTFESRWNQQTKVVKTFWGYFIVIMAIALFLCFCYLADINHGLKNE